MLSSSLGRSLSVLPPVHFCFSPHAHTDLSLNPLGAAIDQATSSVFFSIAQTTSGPTREAIDRLVNKKVFSYGISDKHGGLTVKKPDGSFGIRRRSRPEPIGAAPRPILCLAGDGAQLQRLEIGSDRNRHGESPRSPC
jgi:hypothetical protein